METRGQAQAKRASEWSMHDSQPAFQILELVFFPACREEDPQGRREEQSRKHHQVAMGSAPNQMCITWGEVFTHLPRPSHCNQYCLHP